MHIQVRTDGPCHVVHVILSILCMPYCTEVLQPLACANCCLPCCPCSSLCSRRIELGDWSLQLCPLPAAPAATSASAAAANSLLSGLASAGKTRVTDAGAGADSNSPRVIAAQGPADSGATGGPVAAATPVTPGNATAAPDFRASAAANTNTSSSAASVPDSDEGILSQLLARLDA